MKFPDISKIDQEKAIEFGLNGSDVILVAYFEKAQGNMSLSEILADLPALFTENLSNISLKLKRLERRGVISKTSKRGRDGFVNVKVIW